MKYIQLKHIKSSPVSHNAKIKKKVLVAANEYHNIMQLAQAVFPVGEIALGHIHVDITEVFTIISGTAQMQVDDTVQTLSVGETLVVEAGEYHELRNTGSEPLVVNYFSVLSRTNLDD